MIELKGILNAYPISSSVGKSVRKSESEMQASEYRKLNADSVSISPDAAFRSELSKACKIYSQEFSAFASSERIHELQEKYCGDSCPVSGIDIARAIFQTAVGR